ncbi:MAG TPA: ABC transporter permease [Myxococcota bacterium]|nr:ABC transporter permease [Myxococcota bacterium]
MIRRLWALSRKELRQLFASPIAYVVLTVYVALTGIYFFQHLVSYNQLLFVYQSEGMTGGGFDQGTVPTRINVLNEVFVPSADDFGLFLLVVLPLVTMRVFAEERANGTDELLLTSGLRPYEVALAKHGVTYGFVMLLLLGSAIYPAVVVMRASLGMEHLAALYLGQLFYGCAVASIGLACSAFTSSQIVAAVLGYAIPFVLLDFAWLSNTVSEGVAALLREVALLSHYGSFARGVIELRNVVYFAGIIGLGWLVSVASLELSRAR